MSNLFKKEDLLKSCLGYPVDWVDTLTWAKEENGNLQTYQRLVLWKFYIHASKAQCLQPTLHLTSARPADSTSKLSTVFSWQQHSRKIPVEKCLPDCWKMHWPYILHIHLPYFKIWCCSKIHPIKGEVQTCILTTWLDVSWSAGSLLLTINRHFEQSYVNDWNQLPSIMLAIQSFKNTWQS